MLWINSSGAFYRWDGSAWQDIGVNQPPDYTGTYWKQWAGTQLEYDAIAIKDPNTLYTVIS
jgi:hypothetical protein